MASGRKKRMADALAQKVLVPAGLTSLSEADRGNQTNQNNLMNVALYSKDGTTPTFAAASPTQLSNVLSNTDTAWSLAGLTGEVGSTGVFVSSSLSGTVGLTAAAKHYYFPSVGGVRTDLSGTSGVTPPVIIYSNDGPQSSYVPYYMGGTSATGSIKFGSQITGSGTPTHVAVYVGGKLTNGDQIRILDATGSVLGSKFATGSDVTFPALTLTSATASAAQLAASLYRKAFLIPTGSISSGMIVEFSSSAKTSTTPVPGVFVVISSGSYT